MVRGGGGDPALVDQRRLGPRPARHRLELLDAGGDPAEGERHVGGRRGRPGAVGVDVGEGVEVGRPDGGERGLELLDGRALARPEGVDQRAGVALPGSVGGGGGVRHGGHHGPARASPLLDRCQKTRRPIGSPPTCPSRFPGRDRTRAARTAGRARGPAGRRRGAGAARPVAGARRGRRRDPGGPARDRQPRLGAPAGDAPRAGHRVQAAVLGARAGRRRADRVVAGAVVVRGHRAPRPGARRRPGRPRGRHLVHAVRPGQPRRRAAVAGGPAGLRPVLVQLPPAGPDLPAGPAAVQRGPRPPSTRGPTPRSPRATRCSASTCRWPGR